MPENCTILPEGYCKAEKVELQKNKKTALFVNLFSLELFAVFLVPLFFMTSVPSLMKSMLSDVGLESLIATFSLCAGIIVYLILHELTHGICMKIFGKAKVRFGFTGLYAFAGSMAYFNKRSYIITALAPIVIWSVVFIPLLVHTYLFYSVYFHVFYILEVINIAGSAGDIFMAAKVGRMDRCVLIRDSGTDMVIYSREI